MKMTISKWAVVLLFLSSIGIFAQNNNKNPQQNGNATPQKPEDIAKEKLKEFKTAFGKSKSEAEKVMLIQGLQDYQSKEILAELKKIAKENKMEEVRKAVITQIGDRYRGKEAAVALVGAFTSAARTMSKNLEILAIYQMGRMATPPITSAKPQNRQTTVYTPDPKTMEYASKFLNWLIVTYCKDIDTDIALAALDSIGKLRSRYSVDPLLAFLKYYQDQQAQLSQQVQQVNTQQVAQMQQQAAQARQSRAAPMPAQAPKTTTTTTTTGGTDMTAAKAQAMEAMGMGTGKGEAADAAAYNQLVGGAANTLSQGASQATNATKGTPAAGLGSALGGMDSDLANMMNGIVGMNGVVGGNSTTTTTTTGGAPGGMMGGAPSAAPGATGPQGPMTYATGQTYAQMCPQLDDKCKKLIPATVNSLKGVTRQNYYMWADWNKWWTVNRGFWKP